MFALCSDITIGQFKMKPHDVKVNKSIYEYADKAVIKLPLSARIKKYDTLSSVYVLTAKQFEPGDKVIINLGFNGSLTNEFTGFVRRINLTTPLEVECEGYSYQLRMQQYEKTFINAQLLDVLKYLVLGTDIVLDTANIPGFKIDRLIISKGTNGCQVLEEIKKLSHNLIQFSFTGNILWGGLIFMNNKNVMGNYPQKGIVKYQLGWNVIKDDNLKVRESNGDLVTVIYGMKTDGTKQMVETNGTVHKVRAKQVTTTGNIGMKKVIKTTLTTDAASQQQMGMASQYKLNYDGYEGKITAFLQPYCEPAYQAVITDLKYPDRNGTYNIESTEVQYGMKGARRIVGIGIKLF